MKSRGSNRARVMVILKKGPLAREELETKIWGPLNLSDEDERKYRRELTWVLKDLSSVNEVDLDAYGRWRQLTSLERLRRGRSA